MKNPYENKDVHDKLAKPVLENNEGHNTQHSNGVVTRIVKNTNVSFNLSS